MKSLARDENDERRDEEKSRFKTIYYYCKLDHRMCYCYCARVNRE